MISDQQPTLTLRETNKSGAELMIRMERDGRVLITLSGWGFEAHRYLNESDTDDLMVWFRKNVKESA